MIDYKSISIYRLNEAIDTLDREQHVLMQASVRRINNYEFIDGAMFYRKAEELATDLQYLQDLKQTLIELDYIKEL